MSKPTPKREVSVESYVKEYGWIRFYSSQDTVTEFMTFGKIHDESFLKPNFYWLVVDTRYDFDEVLEYIERYG